MLYTNCFIFTFSFYFFFICFAFKFQKYINAAYFSFFNFFILFFLFIISLSLWNQIFVLNDVWELKTDNLVSNSWLIPLSINCELNILSFSFFFLVVCIGLATNLYLFNYLKGEANEFSFIFWLNCFIFSMMLLILASNLYTLFFGWELIGLTSFFLINFWSNRRSTFKSSFKAFFFNLFSDVCLLASFVILYYCFGTDDLNVIFYFIQYSNINNIYLLQFAAYLLVAASSVKSVQILGHLWLPDSMEAPVPASALIHSATLVSAGIYILLKFHLFIYVFCCLDILFAVGVVTALYGALVCSAQTDLKKLLAYSTMSHCGFLWISALTSNFLITIFYLFLHGLYKAATFYCAGSFIRLFNSQDTRWMGNGLKMLPVDSFFLLFCSANLAALPFTIGFLYKFFFLKLFFLSHFFHIYIGTILLAANCSIIYFYRLNFYLLNDFYKNVKNVYTFYLQKNLIQIQPTFSFVKLNVFTALVFLVLISFLVLGIFYFLNSNLFILNNYNLYTFQISYNLYSFYFEKLFVLYYLLFYFLYSFLIIWLIFVSLKKNKNFIELAFFFFYFIFFIFFFVSLHYDWRIYIDKLQFWFFNT